VQVREIMTGQVATVGPDTSAKSAAEVMASRGFAALPVVDGTGAVIGIVAEADVLRSRLPQDPRLHLRRDDPAAPIPPLAVGGVMTTKVTTVPATADVADLGHLFLDEGLRSVPVLDEGRLVGIVSRRDVLRTLARSDDDIRREVHRLVDSYTGEADGWTVQVSDGVVSLTGADAAVDASAVRTLARTVPGVVAVRPLMPRADRAAGAAPSGATGPVPSR
jgi:CBS domain-containing protein